MTTSPENFKGGGIWNVIVGINDALKAIAYALLVLFFVIGVMKTCGSFTELKRPEVAFKCFIRFVLAQAAVTYGMELMTALFSIAPIPLSSFAGQPSSSIGMAFIKSYAAICLEGCVILLACIIFSQFASSPPVVTEGLAPATVVWNYIGELVFNMLVLVGSIKMSDRIIRELMGLG